MDTNTPSPRRRVRCDERKPYCKGCVRLGHECKYAAAVTEPKHMQLLQHTLLPAPAAIWTEADSLRVAYFNAFQSYDPTGLSNCRAFMQIIPKEGISDDLFHNICLSLGALSLSSVAQSLAAYDVEPPAGLSPCLPSDSKHALAVRYYTTALSRLRERLGSAAAPLPPRTLLLSMVAMAYFEAMQGNTVASCHMRLSCFTVLSDVVIHQAQKDPQGSGRFGLTTLYKDDLAVEEIEAVHIRLSAVCLLGMPEQFDRTNQRTVPIPPLSLEKPAHPDTSSETFQTSWNTFAQRFESWKLAVYWAICINGTSATLPNFLDDQQILLECFQSWEDKIRSRIALKRCLSLPPDHLQALKLILLYVRSMQLLLAPEDEDLQKFEGWHALGMADIARLPLSPMPRFIGGLFFGSWNDFMMDTRLLPMIKFLLYKRRCCTAVINFELAKLQLDLGEAIWYALKQWYYNPITRPVRPRISWTILLGKHFRDLFKKTVNDMSQENHSSSSDST